MAKRKKYSLVVEGEDIVGVEVNGTRYSDALEIPNAEDRSRVERMVDGFHAAEFAAADQEVSGPSKAILWVFAGVTVLILTIFAVSSIIIGRGVMKEETAQGRVMEMVQRKDSEDRVYYYPVVEFNLPDGSIERVQIAEGSWPPAFVIGQPVAVRYDPQQPQSARIQTLGGSIALWTLPIITGVLGAAFLGGTFFVRWMLKPEPVKKPFEDAEFVENA